MQAETGPCVHPIETELRRFSGGRLVRIVDGGNSTTPEHSHDWPILSLFVMGDYRKLHQDGETKIAGPSAVLHCAGAPHTNIVGGAGLEQVELQFDPAWLQMERSAGRPVNCWIGGRVATAARWLASVWMKTEVEEPELIDCTRRFLSLAVSDPATPEPPWLGRLLERLEEDEIPSTRELARELDLHSAWLARAYRAAVGEGLQDTLRRRRVQRAVSLLRESGWPTAEVAIAAGFCDQSHMNRGFQHVLGRSPVRVRGEQIALAAFAS